MLKSIRSKTVLSVISAMLLLASSQASLAETGDGGARREAMELRIEELKTRLALTTEQESQLAPLIDARNARLRELRSSAGGDTSRRARIATLKEARKIQEDFNARIAPILTKAQQTEWEQIRKEVRATAKERMRDRE
jgi:DNA repair photolyase